MGLRCGWPTDHLPQHQAAARGWPPNKVRLGPQGRSGGLDWRTPQSLHPSILAFSQAQLSSTTVQVSSLPPCLRYVPFFVLSDPGASQRMGWLAPSWETRPRCLFLGIIAICGGREVWSRSRSCREVCCSLPRRGTSGEPPAPLWTISPLGVDQLPCCP